MAKNQVKQANQPKNQYNSISELDTKQKSDIAVWLYEIYRDDGHYNKLTQKQREAMNKWKRYHDIK